MMNTKLVYNKLVVISGGQTGADRAALDVALDLGHSIDGWCPSGRWAEDGTLPDRYTLRETTESEPSARTLSNILYSDATLVLLFTYKLDAGTNLTIELSRSNNRKLLVVRDQSAEEVNSWINANKIQRLNIAGPRESKAPGIYKKSYVFLSKVLENER